MSSFGYGIVGCGWVAPSHGWGVRALADEGVRLIAVADKDLRRAKHIAEEFGAQFATQAYEELLQRDDIDAVSICLPDFLHRNAALAAAAAGKHVLCEKPLALNVAEADEMVLAFERAGLALGLVMNHRYAADNIRVKRAIQDGAIGRILVASVVHSSALTGNDDGSSPWRGRRGLVAGGILTTQAIHFLDLLLWFAGPVSSVKAWADNLVHPRLDYEDTAALALKLQSGAVATLATTNGAPIMDDITGTRIELHGTEGHIVLDAGRVRVAQLRDGAALPEVQLPAPPKEAVGMFGVGHIHEIADFVRSIRRGDPPPVPGADGRHLMAVLSAAYASCNDDREVQVREHLPVYQQSSPKSQEEENAP